MPNFSLVNAAFAAVALWVCVAVNDVRCQDLWRSDPRDSHCCPTVAFGSAAIGACHRCHGCARVRSTRAPSVLLEFAMTSAFVNAGPALRPWPPSITKIGLSA